MLNNGLVRNLIIKLANLLYSNNINGLVSL